MAVKNLVAQFESYSSSRVLANSVTLEKDSQEQSAARPAGSSLPISSPARFLKSQNIARDSAQNHHIAAKSQPSHEMSLDITDYSTTDPRPLPQNNLPIDSRLFLKKKLGPSIGAEDEYPFLPTNQGHMYEATTPSNTVEGHSSNVRPYDYRRKHAPIPSTVVFSRDAPPLHLRKLDKHLSALPLPDFCDGSGAIFSPMDKLAESRKSLDDLEANSGVAPAWRNRKTLLGATVNIVLGIMVCLCNLGTNWWIFLQIL
ncbi:hypothetical protein H0H81_011218 [Sphagnurus paluster]|uniref:Uncharacterized protein n=1 Tax=Sphagnurus paluster TaxID=117069 RepID=A0A9P7K563_9AGAR|nr:hypothetical protein H0H81_011218 [Sphagnurus paluster]